MSTPQHSTDDAYLLGLRHGGEDAREDPSEYTPTYGNLWIGKDHELASAYADGYVAEWNATLDGAMSYQFDRSSGSKLDARMADGHKIRKGHELRGVWVYSMPGYRTLQRTCCK